jgi:hypothetical protein
MGCRLEVGKAGRLPRRDRRCRKISTNAAMPLCCRWCLPPLHGTQASAASARHFPRCLTYGADKPVKDPGMVDEAINSHERHADASVVGHPDDMAATWLSTGALKRLAASGAVLALLWLLVAWAVVLP